MNGCIRTVSDCSTMSPMGPCRAVMDMISLSMQQVTSQPRKYQEPLYWIGHVASSYRGDLGCSGPLLPIFTRLLYNCHAAQNCPAGQSNDLSLLLARPVRFAMVGTTHNILAALSAGAALVHALPVEDSSKPGNGLQDPFAVLDPQQWVNPDDSR